MQLSAIDWAVIASYFLLSLAIGYFYRSRASKSIEEFFVSGRDTPWWLAGTSMVATTFAADTPLAVTGIVATGGIAGNWLWWSYFFSGMLTVIFFARLWRRSGVITDVEFAELRYSGKPAAFLRGFRACYLAVPINCIVMGWVNLAMVKVLTLTLGIDKLEAIFLVLGITGLTCLMSALSGLRGVLVADLIQFILMMSMAIVLAFVAVDALGGIAAMKARFEAIDGGAALDFFPAGDSAALPTLAFFVYLTIVWWAAWYPGSEPGGGGFVAQRMFSTKNERESVLATLWFNIAYYGLRPWPWILVALASILLYPGLEDPESGYVRVMIDLAPPALRGLMVAGFLAAFMSTISTQLNWGASYLVSDIYRRFLRPDATERQLVKWSRISTVALAVASAAITFYMDSIAGAWKLIIATGAGTGGVLILRWFWWRINAWSEVSAMTAAAIISVYLQSGAGLNTDKPLDFANLMLITVAGTTAVWLAVTYLTSPEPSVKLRQFYRLARPYPLLWMPIAKLEPDVRASSGIGPDLLSWVSGCLLISGSLLGFGKLILMEWTAAAGYLTLAAIGAVAVSRAVGKSPRPEGS